jgi:hypothetical protein
MEKISEELITFVGRVGKPASDILYTHINYHGKLYSVAKVKHNGSTVKFIIDTESFSKIKDYSWHHISNGYIGHTIPVDDTRRELYLHNIIMGRLGFPGKGSKESIDHINRNGLDNREENLRLITQSEQNLNQKQKERRVELPEGIGITVEDLPKHVWYIKANGSHGDRFGIDLKTENIKWKTTSAKNISIQDKLKSAKEQLQEYYKTYPYLNPLCEDKNKEMEELTKSYEEIIGLVE